MGPFELIPLPYASDALEPVISRETLSFHYGKHLQTYVNGLNAALPGSGLEGHRLEDIVVKSEGALRKHAGQTLNHNVYFTQFRTPGEESKPMGSMSEAIVQQFGDYETFQKVFVDAGVSLFGSGWVWLSSDSGGKVHITQETNAANPVQRGLRPLLTFDVWEHAYYLDYQNRRADHLNALWQIVDWNVVNGRFEAPNL